MSLTRADSRAFTLVEVLVALAIFSISALALANGFNAHLKTNLLSEQKSGAILAAGRVLDGYRVQDPTTFPASGTAAAVNIPVGNRTYAVTVTFCSPNTYCTSNNIRALHVEAALNGTLLYQVDTVFAQLR